VVGDRRASRQGRAPTDGARSADRDPRCVRLRALASDRVGWRAVPARRVPGGYRVPRARRGARAVLIRPGALVALVMGRIRGHGIRDRRGLPSDDPSGGCDPVAVDPAAEAWTARTPALPRVPGAGVRFRGVVPLGDRVAELLVSERSGVGGRHGDRRVLDLRRGVERLHRRGPRIALPRGPAPAGCPTTSRDGGTCSTVPRTPGPDLGGLFLPPRWTFALARAYPGFTGRDTRGERIHPWP